MNQQRSTSESLPADQLDPEQVLTSWMSAVACFQLNYNQIYSYVHERTKSEKIAIKVKLAVSQCSIDQLEALLDKMQQQLEILLKDIESSAQPPTQANYQKLITHINALEILNQQAQKMLVLTILPAS